MAERKIPQAIGWRPISTAPTNGARVLLYRRGYAESTAVGWWSDTWAEWQTVNGAGFPGVSDWHALPAPPDAE